MNYQQINIYPNITIAKKIVKAEIIVLELRLFESVKLMIRLMDENDCIIDARVLTMDNETYKNWNNDDSYVIKWVKEQLSKS
jgi:hypothetical protein